jgi:anti-sigma-K factor RskA
MSDRHPRDELAAFALDALDASEAAVIEAHLRRCPECQALLADYRDVSAGLALRLPPAEPGPALRRRVLEAARGTGDLDGASGGVPAAARPGWAAALRRNLVAALAAAIAVVALSWGVLLQARVNRLAEENARLAERAARYDRVRDVLEASQFMVRELTPDGAADADGRVYFDAGSGNGMLMVKRLPRPPEGSVYQVWLVRDGQRTSVALFRTGDGGDGYTFLRSPEPIGAYQDIGITLEPAGGSAAPTSPRLLGARLSPA